MNVFNRVLVVVLSLGLIVFLTLALWRPGASLATLDSLVRGAQPLTVAPGLYIAWVALGVLLLLAVLLIVLELRRPQRLTVKVRQAGGGVVELTTESVCRSLEYHIGQVPGVTQVKLAVISKGASVQVLLDLETDPLMDVPAKSEEVIQLTRELIEGKLGLKMAAGGLRVNVRQAPYRQGSGAGPAIEPPDTAVDLPLQ